MSTDAEPLAVMVEVAVPVAEVDVVSGALWAAGVAGIEERPQPDGSVLLRTAPTDPADLETVHTAVADRPGVRLVPVRDDAWLDAWRAHARPWRAGRALVVWPAWQPRRGTEPGLGEGDVVIELDPGRAFGSGSHPSTRLALAALERIVVPGVRVLDVGCGSGVLAVAAARLGAAHVTALDVDAAAVETTRANAARNGVAAAITASIEPFTSDGPLADVVVANILAPVLRDLATPLRDRTAPGGHVVVAGLLVGQLDGVVSAIGLPVRRTEQLDGWVAATLGGRPAPESAHVGTVP